MSRPTPGPLEPDPDQEDALTARLISEAGDPAVAPRPEHAAVVRSAILGRLGPARRPGRRKARLLAASAVAAVAIVGPLLALALALARPKLAWGQVAEAMQGRPWTHGKVLGPDGQAVAETWFSPRNAVMGLRQGAEVEFHDLTLRSFTRYVPAEGTLYRLPEQDDRMTMGLDFYRQLLDEHGPSRSPIAGMDLVGQSRREVVEGGRRWLDIELTLKVVAAGRPPQKARFRVDPATRLPHSFTFEATGGRSYQAAPAEVTTFYDYPATGPADVYDMGVPRTAKVVDRIPGDDLSRIGAGLKAGRNRFDDYRGLVIMQVGPGHVEDVSRVWRKGRKWRVEALHPAADDFPQPQGGAEAWWKAHERDYSFVPTAVCDGEKVRYYRAKGNSWDPKAKLPPPVELSMTRAINPSDDPFMPWPHVLPEQLAHPSIWPPSESRAILVDPKPLDGPPGTIRVRVRDPRTPDDSSRFDHSKLWIDPLRNYVSMRTETSVPQSGNPTGVAFIETQIVEALAHSPGGHAYPTRVRRLTFDPNKPVEDFTKQAREVTSYCLDFAAEIPDALFRPL